MEEIVGLENGGRYVSASQRKMVIVVAPDEYAKLARKLAHDLSKIDSCQAAYWSIKQFKDNEYQISTHYVVFVGNDKENPFTKDYHLFIDNVQSEGGLCYGYDANRALVYSDPKKFSDVTIQLAKDKSIFEMAGVFLGSAVTPLLFAAWIGKLVYDSHKKLAEIMEVATLTAIQLFLEGGAVPWLNAERDAV